GVGDHADYLAGDGAIVNRDAEMFAEGIVAGKIAAGEEIADDHGRGAAEPLAIVKRPPAQDRNPHHREVVRIGGAPERELKAAVRTRRVFDDGERQVAVVALSGKRSHQSCALDAGKTPN